MAGDFTLQPSFLLAIPGTNCNKIKTKFWKCDIIFMFNKNNETDFYEITY